MTIKLFSFLRTKRQKADAIRQAKERNAICTMFEDAADDMNLGDMLVMMRYIIQDRRHEVEPRHLQDFGNAMCRLGDIADREVA